MMLLIPLLCASVGILAVWHKTNLFAAFAAGARNGLQTLLHIFPALLLLLPMIRLMEASGLLDALSEMFAPLLGTFGIPAETVPILFLRPFSGSGALAAATAIIAAHGPDSLVGRTAAVMLGSTETTFYVLTVYFAGIGKTDTKRILPAALLADLVGYIMAAVTVRLF